MAVLRHQDQHAAALVHVMDRQSRFVAVVEALQGRRDFLHACTVGRGETNAHVEHRGSTLGELSALFDVATLLKETAGDFMHDPGSIQAFQKKYILLHSFPKRSTFTPNSAAPSTSVSARLGARLR